MPVEADAAEEKARVIADAAPQLALEASEQPNALVFQIVLDRAAPILRSAIRSDARKYVAPVTGSTNGVGVPVNLTEIAVAVADRSFADEIACSANQRPLLFRQQRIVAIDGLGVGEVTRWTESAKPIGPSSP